MDRRKFLATSAAAAVAPVLPVPAAPVVGIDLARAPDQTVFRMLSVQRGLIKEIHRVTGVPRYRMGKHGASRDTWMEQVDAGLSEIIKIGTPDKVISDA